MNGQANAIDSSAEADQATNFLERLYPEGFWVLTAIDPVRKRTETRTFTSERIMEAQEFIRRHNGTRNLYFHVNQPAGALKKKASKADIERAHYLHVDIDCRAGEERESGLRRIWHLLGGGFPNELPRPHIIIFSGNGYQAFWRLDNAVEIGGDIEAAMDFERYNKALELTLGGDNCHDVSRLMRLPGTVNIPNEKKLKRGRVRVEARLNVFEEGVISLDQLTPVPQVPQRDTAWGGAARRPDISGDVDRIDDINLLDEWTVPDKIKVMIVQGKIDVEDMTEKQRSFSDSEWVFYAVCALLHCEVPDEVIYSIITDSQFGISAHVLRQGNTERYATRQIQRGHERAAADPPLLSPNAPLPSARLFVARYRPTLMHYNDDWLAYDGAAYRELEAKTIRSKLYAFLDRAVVKVKDGIRPFNPTKAKVGNVVDALGAEVHRPRDEFTPPCWLEGDGPPPREIVARRNGLLHLPTNELHPLTERFFTRNALDFSYDANAAVPEKWLQFLAELWPEQPDVIGTLQEIFGYVLIPDTSQQKVFMLVGPKRSGKGTIARVLTHLVGAENTCAPTLKSMAGDFGLEPLIGKQFAIISDLRLGPKTDQAAVAEDLLRISGEDLVSANRKYKRAWHGRLAVRFLIMTNQLPRFVDASGALANRFVPLLMTESFFGRENHGLLNELLAELPGILGWAIQGWRRLQERGNFAPPNSSREAIQNLADLASPALAFIRDECEFDVAAVESKGRVFDAWRDWCRRNGDVYSGTKEVFCNLLLSAGGGRVAVTKPRAEGKRVPSFRGIRLHPKMHENDDQQIPF